MTFAEMQAEIAERMNLTSAPALARIGRSINERYRWVSSTLGLQTTARATVRALTVIGNQAVTFGTPEVGAEKLYLVYLGEAQPTPSDVPLPTPQAVSPAAITGLVFTPAHGPEAGGTPFQIASTAGFDLTRIDSVKFSSNYGAPAATALVKTPALLTGVTPYGYGDCQVNLSYDSGAGFQALVGVWTYDRFTISPPTGPAGGGTDFTITCGYVFAAEVGATTVTFGGVPATGISVVSRAPIQGGGGGDLVTGKTPAHAAGAVDVGLAAGGTNPQQSTVPSGFTYVDTGGGGSGGGGGVATHPFRILTPIEVGALRLRQIHADPPRCYAIWRMGPHSVTILLDAIPETVYPISADVESNVAVLSGAMVPNFAASFHDLLIHGGMATELEKMEKYDMAKVQEQHYEQRLADLRFFIAKNAFNTFYQGKHGRADRAI